MRSYFYIKNVLVAVRSQFSEHLCLEPFQRLFSVRKSLVVKLQFDMGICFDHLFNDMCKTPVEFQQNWSAWDFMAISFTADGLKRYRCLDPENESRSIQLLYGIHALVWFCRRMQLTWWIWPCTYSQTINGTVESSFEGNETRLVVIVVGWKTNMYKTLNFEARISGAGTN